MQATPVQFSRLTATRLCEEAKLRSLSFQHQDSTISVEIGKKERVMLFVKAIILSVGFLFAHCRCASSEAFKQAFAGKRFVKIEANILKAPRIDSSGSGQGSSPSGAKVEESGDLAADISDILPVDDSDAGSVASSVHSSATRRSSAGSPRLPTADQSETKVEESNGSDVDISGFFPTDDEDADSVASSVHSSATHRSLEGSPRLPAADQTEAKVDLSDSEEDDLPDAFTGGIATFGRSDTRNLLGMTETAITLPGSSTIAPLYRGIERSGHVATRVLSMQEQASLLHAFGMHLLVTPSVDPGMMSIVMGPHPLLSHFFGMPVSRGLGLPGQSPAATVHYARLRSRSILELDTVAGAVTHLPRVETGARRGVTLEVIDEEASPARDIATGSPVVVDSGETVASSLELLWLLLLERDVGLHLSLGA